MPVIALVDCNNFYASCEKLFEPKLRDRAVVVLSNNDGCVVARSAEAKVLGVPMGAPWFQLQELASRHGIVALSSNYALYADMSSRVVRVLADFSPAMEVYSIDESFLDLAGLAGQPAEIGREIRAKVFQWTGLPVCVGIAATKTLAKLANHSAKKALAGADGVCDFGAMCAAELDDLFEQIPVSKVWGVGRRIDERLAELRIGTVRQLRDADPAWIRERFSVVLERTVRELQGVPCLTLEDLAPAKQQIIASRSFGAPVFELDGLAEALTSHTARAAEKLRAQRSVAGVITVTIRSNPFKPSETQYHGSLAVPLAEPSADTRALVQAALCGLRRLYRSGIAYKKAGVTLSCIEPVDRKQGSLLVDETAAARSAALMQTMDAINRKWGRGTILPLAAGVGKGGWRMRRERLSPAYTTQWDELPSVFAK